jgi:hypothetical protein
MVVQVSPFGDMSTVVTRHYPAPTSLDMRHEPHECQSGMSVSTHTNNNRIW